MPPEQQGESYSIVTFNSDILELSQKWSPILFLYGRSKATVSLTMSQIVHHLVRMRRHQQPPPRSSLGHS